MVWMTHLGGSAEQTLPMLERFAAAGHPAVSFAPVLHGARGSGDPWAFATEVLAAFRRRMWPILGQTTLEAMRVLTWAQEQSGRPGTGLAGGVSMGGDVAVALAGIDPRVRRVATVAQHRIGRGPTCASSATPRRSSTRANPTRSRSGTRTTSTRAVTSIATSAAQRSPSSWAKRTTMSPRPTPKRSRRARGHRSSGCRHGPSSDLPRSRPLRRHDERSIAPSRRRMAARACAGLDQDLVPRGRTSRRSPPAVSSGTMKPARR